MLARLQGSRFRARFKLGPRELATLREKGIDAVIDHGRAILRRRLAPAQPRNDGRQTPMRGHPIFVAQHATATCCRSCLAKWHRIEAGRAMTENEIEQALSVIRAWLEAEAQRAGIAGAAPAQPGLFE